MRATTAQLEKTDLEHGYALENGTRAFGGINDRLAIVEERTIPKPPSVLKIVIGTIGVFLTCAAALWALSNMLRDRPTSEQIEKIMDKHDGVGHPGVRGDVRQIKTDQAAQKLLIEGIDTEQGVQGEKLDTLLLRTPEPRKSRNRNR